jgi:hypothetical protein
MPGSFGFIALTLQALAGCIRYCSGPGQQSYISDTVPG